MCRYYALGCPSIGCCDRDLRVYDVRHRIRLRLVGDNLNSCDMTDMP